LPLLKAASNPGFARKDLPRLIVTDRGRIATFPKRQFDHFAVDDPQLGQQWNSAHAIESDRHLGCPELFEIGFEPRSTWPMRTLRRSPTVARVSKALEAIAVELDVDRRSKKKFDQVGVEIGSP
jgi:hypothetical protein